MIIFGLDTGLYILFYKDRVWYIDKGTKGTKRTVNTTMPCDGLYYYY